MGVKQRSVIGLLLFMGLSACTPSENPEPLPVVPSSQPLPSPTPSTSKPMPTPEVTPTALPTPSPVPSPTPEPTPQATPTPMDVRIELYVENDNHEIVRNYTLNVDSRDTDFHKEYIFDSDYALKAIYIPCESNYLFTVSHHQYPPVFLDITPICKNFLSPEDFTKSVYFYIERNAAYFKAYSDNSNSTLLEEKKSSIDDISLSLKPRIVDSSFAHISTPLHSPMYFEFSVPMDKQSVEDNFFISSADPNGALAIARGEVVFKGVLQGFSYRENEIIFNKQHLEFEWNDEVTRVEVMFKEGWAPLLPVPGPFRYTIGFDEGMRSAVGIYRAPYYFRFPQANRYFLGLFANPLIYTDPQDFKMTKAHLTPQGYQLDFDTTLFMTAGVGEKEVLLAGGMRDRLAPGDPLSIPLAPAEYPGNRGNVTAFNTAANYLVSHPSLPAGVSWKSLGGEVVYNTADLSHRSVLLHWPTNQSEQAVEGVIWKYTDILLPQDQPLHFALVSRSGALSEPFRVEDLDDVAALKALTADLPLSANPWHLQAQGDQWLLRFVDTQGEYIGMVILEGDYVAKPVTWHPQSALPLQTSGALRVNLSPTVLDVNGNHIDPEQAGLLLP